MGREIGFPTANISLESKNKLVPADGIYACNILHENQLYQGMMYIGDLPSIEGNHAKVIEVNIFDFDKDIYGQEITLELLKFLREDEKFTTLEALKQQLESDKQSSLMYFDHLQQRDLDLTLAILNFNSADFLEMFLPSVSFSSKSDFQTIVIDNASSDESDTIVADLHPEIPFIKLDKNYGFADGYNNGLASVQSKFVVLLNSDVQVTPDWLDPLVSFMDSNPTYGAVMPKILAFENQDSFEYAGAAGGYMDAMAYPFCRGRIFDTIEEDVGQYNSVQDVFWASGAAMVIRTELYHKLGGLDGSYFAHQEEIDFCWRMLTAGYRIAVIPDSKVYHVGGGSLSYGSPQKTYLNFRNSLYSMVKNMRKRELIWKLPLRLVLDGAAGVKYFYCGNPKFTFAILKSHLRFYAELPALIGRRKNYKHRISQLRIGPRRDIELMRPFSIIKQYFMSGKKKFSDLNL